MDTALTRLILAHFLGDDARDPNENESKGCDGDPDEMMSFDFSAQKVVRKDAGKNNCASFEHLSSMKSA